MTYEHYGCEGSGLPWEGYYFSAYGIAVKHGFEGTEEEWLLTLRGDKTELRFDSESNELQWKYTEEGEWHTAMDLTQLQTDLEAATLAQAQASAEAAGEAVEHYPRIDSVSGNWEVWSGGSFVDTGVHAQGEQGPQGETGPTSAVVIAMESEDDTESAHAAVFAARDGKVVELTYADVGETRDAHYRLTFSRFSTTIRYCYFECASNLPNVSGFEIKEEYPLWNTEIVVHSRS